MNTENSKPEENENAAWRAMPIAWESGEPFALPLIPRQIGVRLFRWKGNGAQWVSPLLSNWSSSLNLAADK